MSGATPTPLFESAFRCDVCGRRRPGHLIGVARHGHTNGRGILIESLVNYCLDSDFCEQTAMLNSHTEIELGVLQRQLENLQSYLHDRSLDRTLWFWTSMLGAFVVGFVVRGMI